MSVAIYYVTSEFLKRGRITYDDITRYLAEQSENPSESPLIFDLMIDDFRIKEANFHTFEWQKTATEKRYGESVKAFTKQAATYETTLMLQGSEQYRKDILNKFHNAIEADVINSSPGRIYWEGYYIECYILSSETTPAEGQSPFVTDNKLSIYCPYPFWTKLVDTDYHAKDEGEEQQEDIESVIDYMTIGVIDSGRVEQFYVMRELATYYGDTETTWTTGNYSICPYGDHTLVTWYVADITYKSDNLWNCIFHHMTISAEPGGMETDTFERVLSTDQINSLFLYTFDETKAVSDRKQPIEKVYTKNFDEWDVMLINEDTNHTPTSVVLANDRLGARITRPVNAMRYEQPNQQSAEAGIFGPAGIADFPYDFLADLGRFTTVKNDSAYACNWELVIKGPVTAPAVVINDIFIGVEEVSIPVNASLVINSRDKTILLVYSNGETENFFGYRIKAEGNYVFEKIPHGTFTASVNDSFEWSLTLFDERSEPKWTP